MTDFGVLLRKHRLARMMSQEELAIKTGLSRSTISHWEVLRVPTYPQLEKLAEALEISVTELTGADKRNGKEHVSEFLRGSCPAELVQWLDIMGYELKIVPKSNK